MGSGTHSENNHNHHHHHQKNILLRNGNSTTASSSTSSSSTNKTFFPILCRVSVKDTIISHHPTNIIICPKKDDPSSPRVSCMGQVKHHHHNHHHHHLTPSSAIKHHHKIVSGKPANNIIYNQTMVDRRRTRKLSTKFTATTKNAHDSRCAAAVVPVLNLAELDPPLPVIKKLPHSSSGETVNLWKRRSRGEGLTNLQIPTFECTHSLQTHAVKSRPSSGLIVHA